MIVSEIIGQLSDILKEMDSFEIKISKDEETIAFSREKRVEEKEEIGFR